MRVIRREKWGEVLEGIILNLKYFWNSSIYLFINTEIYIWEFQFSSFCFTTFHPFAIPASFNLLWQLELKCSYVIQSQRTKLNKLGRLATNQAPYPSKQILSHRMPNYCRQMYPDRNTEFQIKKYLMVSQRFKEGLICKLWIQRSQINELFAFANVHI